MKFDIVRQQVFTSLITLFVMSAVGFFVLLSGGGASFPLVATTSLFSPAITNFQLAHSFWSSLFAAIMIFRSASRLGRVISTQNFFGVSASIHIPLLGVLMWCVTLGENYLISAIVAGLSSRLFGDLMLSVRRNGSYGVLFDAAMAMSLLSMIYPPAVALWVVVPIALMILGVTVREWIVSVVGLLLPVALTSYVSWLMGSPFLTVGESMISMFLARSELFDFKVVLLFRTAIVALSVLLSVFTMLWFRSNGVFKARARFQIAVILLFVSLLTLVVPSATLLSFALVAPVAAILATSSLVHLRGRFANVVYLVLLFLLLLAVTIPIYLPL